MSNKPSLRSDFVHFDTVDTRWSDNDVYGHVNNVVYYSYFDTVVNRLLIKNKWLDPGSSPIIAVVAETSCRYFASISYPQRIDVGLTVERLGNTSVIYRLGVFSQNSDSTAAVGRFVHVYVDRENRKPVAIPEALGEGLKAYLKR
ncbi:MAG: acyl-CoA thioester hydrolase [Paraglaciecola sp.]|jgi:acyl-CoA thioester hydrolase